MTIAFLGVLAWLTSVGFLCVLGRAAALGDLEVAAELQSASRLDGLPAASHPERRESPGDRRTGARPWADGTTGRRRTDVLEDEVSVARRALREAEERLVEARAQGD